GLSTYLYGGEPLNPYANMALPTALAFVSLSAGTFCSRTDVGLMALVIEDSPAGLVARRLIPAALVLPILFGWLRLAGERHGYFGTEGGVSLMALSNVLVFGALIWSNAALLRRTDAERHRADVARRESERLLRTIADNSTAVIYMKDLEGRY